MVADQSPRTTGTRRRPKVPALPAKRPGIVAPQPPSASLLTLSAARSGLTAPLVCAGCGSEQSLKTVVGNWIINPVTAALAVACAIVFPLS